MVRFPAYVPVVTYDDEHPLDGLMRPYISRLASAAMISFPYARKHRPISAVPLMIDSGGFLSLRKDARIRKVRGLGVIEMWNADQSECIHPLDVLDIQETHADIAFTLDFPVPPGAGRAEVRDRIDLSLNNAFWAFENRRRLDLPLYASIPVTDIPTLERCIADVAAVGFDGIALGGIVPRLSDINFVVSAVESARTVSQDLPLHVFGVGKPETVARLFRAGADSVDSSSFVRAAASGLLWTSEGDVTIADPTTLERLHIALCNLARATGVALPISMAGLALTTHSLRQVHTK